MTRSINAIALAALLVALAPGALALDRTAEQLAGLLRDGGKVVLMRHALTEPGVGDPPGMRVGDCSTQRNLVDEVRRHAKAIGEAVRARGIHFERVFSSPMCRCLETARLAFGRVDEMQPAANPRAANLEAARQVREMRSLASDWRKGGNAILVSHASTIKAATGIDTEPGEMLAVTPQGGGNFLLMGRVKFAPP